MGFSRFILAAAACGAIAALAGQGARAAEVESPPRLKWSFAGPFGRFDEAQLQRGFKVYREVCSTCHGLGLLSFRNLADPEGLGYSPQQAAAVAAEYQFKEINDRGREVQRPGRPADNFPPPFANDQGDMFERNGRPADRFPPPWPNENAARSRYNGVPPDFSVLAKARTYERGFPWFVLDMFTQYQEQGVDYLVALMKGYEEPPKDFTLPQGSSYNKFFPAHSIGMPPPLADGRVEYTDGSPETLDQYAKDVAAFLMWAAEPHLEARKRIGFQVMVFLIVFAGLLYFTKKKVWRAVATGGHA